MNTHIIARNLARLVSRIAKQLVEDANNEALSRFINRNADDQDNILHGEIINSPESKRRYGTMKNFAEWQAGKV